jgi:hypothetical protein
VACGLPPSGGGPPPRPAIALGDVAEFS